jgi:hypothetical protein
VSRSEAFPGAGDEIAEPHIRMTMMAAIAFAQAPATIGTA